jgi:putative DNA primase/helicase
MPRQKVLATSKNRMTETITSSPLNATDKPPRSIADAAQLARVPLELVELPQWVLWKYALVDDRWTKQPYSRDGHLASTDNPATWTTYSEALETYLADQSFDGIGFVFTAGDPYIGIDLDNSLDDGGNLLPWARSFYDRLPGGYCEISPSGRGIKIWLRGAMPDGRGRKKTKLGPDGRGAIEMYSQLRFFTATGRTFP